ncbi:MAG: transglycosylase SLT domain-containing protein [Polyangiaceae bacterium]
MSLVDKIPPLISALAFGYGVGMAAPEVDWSRVQSPYKVDEPAGKHSGRPSIQPLSAALEKRLPGEEPDTLRDLRAARAPSRFDGRRYDDGGRYDAKDSTGVYDEDLAAEAEDLESVDGAAISRLQLPDLGLGVSRQTLKYVRFFTKTDRGRGMFETWLKRSGRYQELISEELRARRLPEDLLWVAMIESGFDPAARSPVGAMGLWQFMPTTGAVYGLKQNKFVDQRRNPRLATQAAAHHLRDLYMRFGQWDLALAAYNMGYEQLLDRIDQVGTTDFNELVRAGALPSETAKYVPKILAAAIVANNLERFDFESVEVAKPVDAGEISVPPRTPLEVVAKAAGVSTQTIRKLNPDILGKALPPGRGDYIVLVPAEAVSRTVAALPGMLQLSRDSMDEDDVLDPVDLMSPDGYRRAEDDENLLSFLPKPKKRRLRDPIGDERLDEIASSAPPADSDDVDDKKGKDTVLYRTGEGETIASIAGQFNLDPEDVAHQNGVGTNEKLKPGTLVKIRVSRDKLDDNKRSKVGSADEPVHTKGKRRKKG